jgi:hypothetical protein
MAEMSGVTKPPDDSMQAQKNSTMVARELMGTAAKSYVSHVEQYDRL